MARRSIRLFMWGYQEHYAANIRRLAEDVLREIGAAPEVEVLLVGVRRPNAQSSYPVCIEPEDGRWPLRFFEELDTQVVEEIPKHRLSRTIYGDEASMRDKPQWTRQAVISEQVHARLTEYDELNDVISLVITPGYVGDYDVAVVLQVPGASLRAFPELKGRGWKDEEYDLSFIRSCLAEVLSVARRELLLPDPGRSIHGDMPSTSEVILRAARAFMHGVVSLVDNHHIGGGLYEQLEGVSALRYEGDDGIGRLLIAADAAVADFIARLEQPVPLRETRWVRKLVQMASVDLPLIASPDRIHGLGRLIDPKSPAIIVDFHGHQDWDVRWEDQLLLRTQLGKPRLPQEAIPEDRFRDNVGRLFPTTGNVGQSRLWEVLRLQVRQPRGSLVIVAEDAESEAKRLSRQSTPITPILVNPELLARAIRIDGGLLLDPTGRCFAVGVILDGETHDECQPSRGARYNSAVRYVYASQTRRMAIVYSDDRTLDVIPLLRPRVSRKKIAAAVAELEIATRETYHRARYFLDKHRFYMSPEQCVTANAAMKRIYATPAEVGEIRLMLEPFEPDPSMNDSYLF